ncbi:MAG: serine/threonine protein kinase [Prevotella sp.]|nr:serine/threonine protein kinase [Prevotella sp.]
MSIIKLQGDLERQRGIFYQVDSSAQPIGVGGMGQVFKGICVNEKTGATRPVAIKFMYDDLPPQAVERARREASIQLRNDNLVEMLGFIEIDEQTPTGDVRKHYHVVSELLNGVSLDDILEGKTKDRNGQDVPFAVKMLQDYKNDPEHFAKTVVVSVLSGLMALHDAGYIHRDIDPSNIMVTSEGHIKLIDFGIAKQMNTLTTSDKALTVAGKFMGKPEYAAPELALGDINHQNQTTDIYAMGILLYQCIVGHTPFEGARHEILEKQIKNKLPLGAIKNKALRDIIATACEKKQELRYQTSAQMRVALENMSGVKRAMSTSKKMTIIGVAAAVLLVLIGVFAIVKSKQNAATEQAEQAVFEQQKTEFLATVNSKLETADKDAAVSNEEDNYEVSLMNAVKAYSEVEQMVKNDSVYGIKVSDITSKKAAAMESLNKAHDDILKQAADLEALGETTVAESLKQRAKVIEEFNTNNH